jgi:hypothetical protein
LDTIIENCAKQLRDGAREECFLDIMLNLMQDESKDIHFSEDNIKAIVTVIFFIQPNIGSIVQHG